MPKGPNPALYRELSKPFASAEEAQRSLDAFFEEVGELRKKYKIPDFLAVVGFAWLADKGDDKKSAADDECYVFTSMNYGDSLKPEAMAAYALGYYEAQRLEAISALMKQGVKTRKQTPLFD